MTALLTPDRRQRRHAVIAAILDDEGIEHFGAGELYRHHNDAWPYEIEFPPPTRLAENIRPTVALADEVRAEWGGPVTVLSGWRCPTYNELIGGSESSEHMMFRALDLQPIDGRYPEFIEHVEAIVEARRAEGQVIGLGRYRTFVHVDCGGYDYNRNWDQR